MPIRIEIPDVSDEDGVQLPRSESIMVTKLNAETGQWEPIEFITDLHLSASAKEPSAQLVITRLSKATREGMICVP